MTSFADIYQAAVMHKGSSQAVESDLPACLSEPQLLALPDRECLSVMSRRIFRAGLKHSMVDAKWPAFERAFHQFEPLAVAMMSDEALEKLMDNSAIIRHFGKIKAVRANAQWMLEVAQKQGRFAAWIAAWPGSDIVNLWAALKKQGTQLGGQSGSRFLRMLGKDTFILTEDVVAVMIALGVVGKMPSTKGELQAVQSVFNQWAEESKRPLCEISRIVSYTADVR